MSVWLVTGDVGVIPAVPCCVIVVVAIVVVVWRVAVGIGSVVLALLAAYLARDHLQHCHTCCIEKFSLYGCEILNLISAMKKTIIKFLLTE